MPRCRQARTPQLTEPEASETTPSTTTRVSRRSRVPKKFIDDDYVVTPSRKRKAQPVDPTEPGTDTPKQKARRKGRRGTKKNSLKHYGEGIFDSESEKSEEESSEAEEDFNPPGTVSDEEEELNLDDIKFDPDEADKSCNFCPWVELDPSQIPKLELPESSKDLVIPENSIFDVIEIYEILRSYHRTLRLTPFTFEEFCAALISADNSCLMAEIHICLLRICLKSDEEEQVHFSVTDTNSAVNIIFHHLDAMTYAEILRMYIESYPGIDDSVRDAVSKGNYPYVGIEPKIVILLFMCYRFLYSSEFHKLVNNFGKLPNDESCRVCGKSYAPLHGCIYCEASFHPVCSNLDPFPEVLVCNICTQNNVKGVTDSLPYNQSIEREPMRMEPIGRDRHGRFYWWAIRRIIVQSEDESEIFVYSTPPQLYQLVQSLDPDYYEKDLCLFIKEHINEMLEQMTLTMELSMEKRDRKVAKFTKTLDSKESAEYKVPQIYYHEDNLKRMSFILKYCAERDTMKNELKEEDGQLIKTEDVKVEMVFNESMLGICDGRLINTFWSGGANEDEVVNYFFENSESVIEASDFFRLGDSINDDSFREYVNYYANNEMSESASARKKIMDKKKYLISKFSLVENDENSFEWSLAQGHNLYGNETLHLKYLEWTIGKLIKKLPTALMHRQWISELKNVEEKLKNGNSYREFAEVLLRLECAMRKTVFVAQWWSSVGQFKFDRTTPDQRDQQSKEFQKIKKMEADALSKELDDSFVKVKYTKPQFPNNYLLRQKGETYRNAGKGAMCGWAWVSNKCVRQFDSRTKDAKIERLHRVIDRMQERLDRNAMENKREESEGVIGENLPWPIPEVQTFKSKNGRNVFVVQNKILRKLVTTAGRSIVYIPGFSSSAKSNHAVWNYPAPRPCFDLCWRWMTLMARSIHAVALQLKILWSAVKWADMEPEDDEPDRRVVIDTPTHDERRRIVDHKEIGPFGQYERYLMEVEIIPLEIDEEEEKDDDAWSSKKERDGLLMRNTRRRKVVKRKIRHPKAIRHDWMDGVDLKLYEIKDYWNRVMSSKNRKAEGSLSARSSPAPRMPMTHAPTVPSTSMDSRKRRFEDPGVNTTYDGRRPVMSHRMPLMSRVAGGAEQERYSPGVRVMSNGYEYPDGLLRGGGGGGNRRNAYFRQTIPVKNPVGESNSEMRSLIATNNDGVGVEEAVSASATTNDTEENPPVIPRYERNVSNINQPVRKQVYVIKRPDGQSAYSYPVARSNNGMDRGPVLYNKAGQRLLHVRPNVQPRKIMTTTAPNSRVFRVPVNNQGKVVRRVMVQGRNVNDIDNGTDVHKKYVINTVDRGIPARFGQSSQIVQSQSMVPEEYEHDTPYSQE